MPERELTAHLLVLLLATACRPSIDVARESQQLLEVDRGWAQLASAGTNADSILSFWSDDAHVVMAGQPLISGKAAIREMLNGALATPGFHVTWTPESAVVAQAGDLAYTFGTNEFTVPDSTGKAITTKGRYITVWRRESEGRWRCVMDYSTPGPADASATQVQGT